MRQRAVWATFVAVGSTCACTSAHNAVGDSADAAAADDAVADGVAPPTGDAAPPPRAGLRFANWSPDAPAVDFCIAPHATTDFQGPMVAAKLQALEDSGIDDDAGTPGLSFPQVGSYFYVTPGGYDVRVVAAGSPDCTVGVVAPDDTTVPALSADTLTTIAAIGDVKPPAGEPTISLASYHDDIEPTLDGGSPLDGGELIVPMRFINAAPSVPEISFGTGTIADSSFVQRFVGVRFGQAGSLQEATATEFTPPYLAEVDGNGYALLASLLPETVSLHAFRTRVDLVAGPQVPAPPGILVTMVAVGDSTFHIVECFDNAGTTGLLSTCNVISP
jgi:hypothetical protein